MTAVEQALALCVLLVQCPDAKGVVAALAQLLFGFNCNILQSDQFTDETLAQSRFFQRIHFDFQDISVGTGNLAVLETAVADLAKRYQMDWKISYRTQRKRMAVLVSKMDHCLFDLLIRQRSGELHCDIPVVISNHPDLGHVAGMFGVHFEHLGFSKDLDRAAAKQQQEAAIQRVLEEANVDLIVLARYMQIFSQDFCAKNWARTINIHHSFLPAFEGAKPYHRAHERGVKIIGATAHYATSELDAGPIIEQDITRITHRDSVQAMVRKGRDLERLVLARAVRWHVNDRVLVTPTGRTVVFQD
ncbi:formyl transferase [Scenedesmus sp. NREL 46B-D3]|nr:formyl transferase [Scenedesmus sp. NREL 46B-D3]